VRRTAHLPTRRGLGIPIAGAVMASPVQGGAEHVNERTSGA
jgi:hypothetical protein